MSYILEALKKSEQERARESGALPDIKSVHAPKSTLHEENRRWWPFVLIGMVIVVGAGLTALYVTRFQSVGEQAMPTHSAPAPVAENRQTEKPVKKQENTTENNPQSNSQRNPMVAALPKKNTIEKKARPIKEQKQPQVVFSKKQLQRDDVIGNVDEQAAQVLEEPQQSRQTEIEPEPVVDTAIAISDIPESVRKQIPSIAFEGHVYSSVPERRSVMINGHKRREGDTISGDLQLKEITAEGAEFEIQGYRFRLNALQDWSR